MADYKMNDILTSISEDIKKELQKNITGENFAVFDFDNSCIVNDVQEALLAYMCRNSLIKNGKLVENCSLAENREDYHKQVFLKYHDLLKDGFTDSYKYAVRTLAGFTEEDVAKLTVATIKSEGNIPVRGNLFGVEIAKGLVIRKNVINLIHCLYSA